MNESRVVAAWRRYEVWLAAMSSRLHGDLLPPATSGDLEACESEIGLPLPGELTELWEACGGQATIDAGVGSFPHLDFLSPRSAAQEWLMWRKVRENSSSDEMNMLSSSSESTPIGAIALTYSSGGWIPVWREEMVANYVGIDLEPGPTGTPGQIISFGRERDSKVVLARSVAGFLDFIATEAEAGNLKLLTDPQSGGEYLRHQAGAIIDVISEMTRTIGPLS